MRGSGLDIGPHCPNGSTQKCVMSLICIRLNQTKQSSVRLSGSVRPRPCQNSKLPVFRVPLYPSRSAARPIQSILAGRLLHWPAAAHVFAQLGHEQPLHVHQAMTVLGCDRSWMFVCPPTAIVIRGTGHRIATCCDLVGTSNGASIPNTESAAGSLLCIKVYQVQD